MSASFTSTSCCSDLPSLRQFQTEQISSDIPVERPFLGQYRPMGPFKLVCAVAFGVMTSMLQGAEAALVNQGVSFAEKSISFPHVFQRNQQDSQFSLTEVVDCRDSMIDIDKQFSDLEEKFIAYLGKSYFLTEEAKESLTNVYETLINLGIQEDKLPKVESILKKITLSGRDIRRSSSYGMLFDEMWIYFSNIYLNDGNYDAAERILLESQGTINAYISISTSINELLVNIIKAYLKVRKLEDSISLIDTVKGNSIDEHHGKDSEDSAVEKVVEYCVENDLTDKAIEVSLRIRGDFLRAELLSRAVKQALRKDNPVMAIKLAVAIPNGILLGNVVPVRELSYMPLAEVQENAYKLIKTYEEYERSGRKSEFLDMF